MQKFRVNDEHRIWEHFKMTGWNLNKLEDIIRTQMEELLEQQTEHAGRGVEPYTGSNIFDQLAYLRNLI